MGLTDESMLPEQYYCEQCRPGSHKVIVDRNGYVTDRQRVVVSLPSWIPADTDFSTARSPRSTFRCLLRCLPDRPLCLRANRRRRMIRGSIAMLRLVMQSGGLL